MARDKKHANDNPKIANEPAVEELYQAEDVSIQNLTPAAKRALDEAAQRREKQSSSEMPKEVNGRKGPEPTRFGDWEKDGIISDF